MGTEEECSGQGVILLFVEKIFKKRRKTLESRHAFYHTSFQPSYSTKLSIPFGDASIIRGTHTHARTQLRNSDNVE